MNAIAFDLEIEKFNGYVFVEKLHIKIGGVCFGEFGGNSERGLVLGGIQDLLQGIEAQARFPRLDELRMARVYLAATELGIVSHRLWV